MRWGGASGLLAALILTAMVAVGLAAGPDSAQLLHPTDAGRVEAMMAEHGGIVQASIVLDDLFVLAYTAAFLGLAALVWSRSRWLAGVAMAWALATAFLDFSENARILAMAQGVGGAVSASALRELAILGQIKFSASHLAAFLFGLALPRRDRLSWVVAVLLFLFPVVSTLAFANELAGMARLLLMWLLLALGGWLAWRESKKPEGEV